MSNIKCPFCQQELKPQTIDGGWLECWNCSYSEPNSKHLPQPILAGSKELWQELIRTRKALDVAVYALKSVRKCLCEMPDPSGATILRMACESATIVKKALEQITALEQKDK